jgi:hypothetical protein
MDELRNWVRGKYGEQFSEDEIINALYGRRVTSLEDYLTRDEPDDEMYHMSQDIWRMLSLAGPGSNKDFKSAFRYPGFGDEGFLSTWYDTGGAYEVLSEEAVRKLHSALQIAIRETGIPDAIPQEELMARAVAENLNEYFKEQVSQTLGSTFLDEIYYPYLGMRSLERKEFYFDSFEQPDPSDYVKIDIYNDMRRDFGGRYPEWKRYYDPD